MPALVQPLPTHRSIFASAWPIILANAAVPLLGLTDAAVIGRVGSVSDLGAIALGALVFNFVYWGFGFLRMGTSGFTARARGAGDEAEVRAILLRALLAALAIGALLALLRTPLTAVAFGLLGGSAEVESTATTYVRIRILGAPAALATFALMGTLIGLGQSGLLLRVQLILSASNIALDVLLAGVLGLGVVGIAVGTAIAEWISAGIAGHAVLGLLRERHRDREPLAPWSRVFDRSELAHTFSANLDILLRTLALVLAFAWFADRGAELGDVVLAANHLLLQLVSLSAFFLDAYAYVAESLVGQSLGARDPERLRASIRRSTELAAVTAMLLAAGILGVRFTGIAWLTDLTAVAETATAFAPWAALYVALAFGAFQLDGVFIGATATRSMRNAAIVATASFGTSLWWLGDRLDNTKLWCAFVVYVVVRALTLTWYLPSLVKQAESSRRAGPDPSCPRADELR